LRRMRHAAIYIVSFYSNSENPSHWRRSSIESMPSFSRMMCSRTLKVLSARFRKAPTARVERRHDPANMLSRICLSWRSLRDRGSDSIEWWDSRLSWDRHKIVVWVWLPEEQQLAYEIRSYDWPREAHQLHHSSRDLEMADVCRSRSEMKRNWGC